MRLLLACIACIGFGLMFAIGGVSALVGTAEQRHADGAYVVGFVPGSDCDDAHELHLSSKDGAVLDCVSAGMFGSGNVSLPGFTSAQNEEVETLAEELGSDGLATVEQREIQNRVDSLAARVQPTERPYGDYAVWGAGRFWLGISMVIVAVLGIVGVLRLASPKQRPPR